MSKRPTREELAALPLLYGLPALDALGGRPVLLTEAPELVLEPCPGGPAPGEEETKENGR